MRTFHGKTSIFHDNDTDLAMAAEYLAESDHVELISSINIDGRTWNLLVFLNPDTDNERCGLVAEELERKFPAWDSGVMTT